MLLVGQVQAEDCQSLDPWATFRGARKGWKCRSEPGMQIVDPEFKIYAHRLLGQDVSMCR